MVFRTLFLRVLLATNIILLVFSVVSAVPAKATEAAASSAPNGGAPTAVYRWHNKNDKDWVTIPEHGSQPSDEALFSSGYVKDASPQYYVAMIGSSDLNMIAVYRWWNNEDRDWVDITANSISDGRLVQEGYSRKTFQYFAYSLPSAGMVTVNRWWDENNKDWVTLRQDEIPDATLKLMGYTHKTFLAYAYGHQSLTGSKGYFTFDKSQPSVVPSSMSPGNYPHTMSVIDVNPFLNPSINKGYRYLGYYGHNLCAGIYIARSNSLDAPRWDQDPNPPQFSGEKPCRWASALVDGGTIDLVVNQVWDSTITAQTSLDELNGEVFGKPTVLVQEKGSQNGNPTLFRDPNTNIYYLYWFRKHNGIFEIRVKSSPTFAGLVGAGPNDLGKLVAYSPELVAAPQVMYFNGKYYLAVETHEGDQVFPECTAGTQCLWKTRVLSSATPTGPFYEIPGNPVFEAGDACVFQVVTGDTLHVFYCKQNDPYDLNYSWSLNHTKANLLNPD